MHIKKVQGEDDYNKAVESSADNVLVVIDFYGEWCAPCKKLEPHLQEFSKKYKNVLFYTVNIDDNQELAKKLSIDILPKIIIYKDQKHLGDVLGLNVEALEEVLEKYN